MSKQFEIGAEVFLRNESSKIGVITNLEVLHAGVQYYKVNFGGGTSSVIPETDLVLYESHKKPHELLQSGKLGNWSEFQRKLIYQKLLKETILTNNIYSFNSSRTIFYPYQFKPLLKFLESSNSRILIADEVGLGKTIEAALIYMELKARQELDRVLVVCPSNLIEKWKMELETRFSEEFNILKTADIMKFLEKYEQTPERAVIKGIIGLESIRQAKVIDRLEELEPDFDLIIFDEAHHLRNSNTRQHRAGRAISANAGGAVMLSATPIQLGTQDLYQLLNILDSNEFPSESHFNDQYRKNEPIVKLQTCLSKIPPNCNEALNLIKMAESNLINSNKPQLYAVCKDLTSKMEQLMTIDTNDQDYKRQFVELQRGAADLNVLNNIFNRTRKKDVNENIVLRSAFSIEVEWTDKEMQFYHTVLNYIKNEMRNRRDMSFIEKWVLQMPERRMSSCISAMVEFYKTKYIESDYSEEERPLESEENDISDPIKSWHTKLKEIVLLWEESGVDSKYLAFSKELRDIRRTDGKCKIIVFSFFKATLNYLSRQLQKEGFKYVLISGDTPHTERYKIIKEFKEDDEIEIMLSSKVGTEGLDLQFCNTMFNYDLPWNPMEVEQRIGRLDRIGQVSEKIRIYNLFIKGTIEERIIERLYNRIGIFENSIGELEPILGELINNLVKDITSKELTEEEQIREADRYAQIIERKKQDLLALEEKSAKFVGIDSYFEDEIDKIKRNRRYITSNQLVIFVQEFIKDNCPRTRLVYDSTTKVYTLYADSELQRLLSEFGSGLGLTPFYSMETGTKMTFDQKVAFYKQDIEFINNTHPFTKFILNYYREHELKFNNANYVLLKSKDVLTKGKYVFIIYRLNIKAARGKNILETVFVEVNTGKAIYGDEAERILGEILENGENPISQDIMIEHSKYEEIMVAAERTFLERMAKFVQESEKNNNLLVEGRISSLKDIATKKISQKSIQLERGLMGRKNEKYIVLLRSTIARLNSELLVNINKEESKRVVTKEYVEVAAGLLEVY